VNRTELQNFIDAAYEHGAIVASMGISLAARMRDENQSTASILAIAKAAIAAKAINDGTTGAAVEAEIAKILGISHTL
jgi:hypothetical protein